MGLEGLEVRCRGAVVQSRSVVRVVQKCLARALGVNQAAMGGLDLQEGGIRISARFGRLIMMST